MRYVTLSIITLICTILTGAIFTRINIFGIAPDMLLIMMVLIIIKESGVVYALYTTAGALLLDILFSSAMGYYAIPYLFTGIIVFMTTKKHQIALWAQPIIVMAAYMLKVCITALLSAVLKIDFDLGAILTRYAVWEMLISGALAFPLMLLINKLYKRQGMQPLKQSE